MRSTTQIIDRFPSRTLIADPGAAIATASWLRDPLHLLRSSFPLLFASGRFAAGVACTCRSSAPPGHSCRAQATSKQRARPASCEIGSRPECCCAGTSGPRRSGCFQGSRIPMPRWGAPSVRIAVAQTAASLELRVPSVVKDRRKRILATVARAAGNQAFGYLGSGSGVRAAVACLSGVGSGQADSQRLVGPDRHEAH